MNNVNFEAIFTKKHHYWRNMVLVLVALIVIASMWYYWDEGESKVSVIDELCSKFELNESEISCKEAVNIALEGYKEKFMEADNSLTESDLDGEIQLIERKNIEMLSGNETMKMDVWIISLKLKNIISLLGIEKVCNIEIAVGRNNGELMIKSYGT